ncbi:MAG: alkaline phosphatase family protein [Bacteroidaceae bacterium]|nr:alkaline phosphatase family protein [Bacteroidaceae bacterium]
MTNLYRYRLLTSLMVLMAMVPAEAQTAPDVPRLVVNIVVDQLRGDYFDAFSSLYGEKGFKRFFRDGRVYRQAEYPFDSPDRASALASLMTGATPYEHGIVGSRWLDRKTLQPVYCVDDKEYNGLLTTEQSSVANLKVSTLTDELKVATHGKGLVYSIAPYRDAAMFGAGHAADGAFWIDDLTGQWCSTDYYGQFPQWALTYNNSRGLKTRISSLKWEPISGLVGNFNYFISGVQHTPFKHSFSGERKVRDLKESAMVNEEVNRFAEYCLHNTDLGSDAVTDFLSLTYYAGNYLHKGVDECPIEQQDTYVRLDANLADLMSMIEGKVGKDRVLYVLTSTGYADEQHTNLEPYRIPTGTFNITRAKLLLNMYLIAVYGQGQYVETSLGNQLYLNLKLLEDRALNQAEVLERSQDFLSQLSGVQDVYTSKRLLQGAGVQGVRMLRNAHNPRVSGDLLILVAPGWHLVNDDTHEDRVSRDSYMGFPLFFLGPCVKNAVVETPVTVDHVAPTVARCLRIRAPNACSLPPLSDFLK